MSTTDRFFYVVYLPEGETRTCLDAIRLIARPQTRFSAHITVRGPYDKPIDGAAQLSDRIRGKLVRVGDVGAFEGKEKAVVFFHCSCPDMVPIWDKPNFDGYSPHLTLFEGDGGFAEALGEILEANPIRFVFRASGLDLLVSGTRSANNPVRDRYDAAALEGILGDDLRLERIDALQSTERLEMIGRIARHLAKAQRTSSRPNTTGQVLTPSAP